MHVVNPYAFASAGGGPLVAHTGKAGSSSGVTTDPIDTTGANLIVIGFSYYPGSGGGTLSDSKGNTWTPAFIEFTIGNNRFAMYYCAAPTVGAGHTFSFSGTTYPGITVSAWSGLAGSPFDAAVTNSSTSSATVSTGSITPAQADTLFVTVMGWEASAGGAISVDSGFTMLDQIPYAGGTNFGCSMAYKVISNGAAENPEWSSTGVEGTMIAGLTAFKF